MEFLLDPVTFLAQWLKGLLLGWGLSASAADTCLAVLGAAALTTGAMFLTVFLIWLERKLLGRIQDRFGPNRVGPWGIFQTVADMLKIFTKEHITPVGADPIPYNLAPILSVAAVLMLWAVIPFSVTIYGVDLNVAVLYLVAVGALGNMAIMLAGWGSNNKYALLAAFRAVAQLISYEVPMVVSLLVPVMFAGSMGLNTIVRAQHVWFIVLSPLAAMVFFISSVAEIGRAPFDLVEAESELVAGFNVEYSGLKFGMYYVADFLHAFTVSLLFATLFLGGWRGPGAEQYPIVGFGYYLLKTSLVYFLIILMRGSLPRFRIDHMMYLNWKLLTPLSLAAIISTALVGKLVQDASPVLRIGSLLATNLVLLWITNRLLLLYTARKKRRVVAPVPRPVARAEAASSRPEAGGSP